MTEVEFLERWNQERSMYEAWGQFVVRQVTSGLEAKIAPLAADLFLRIPPKPRLKGDASILEKAFYRAKPYQDPYAEITDKIGVRFVVLLAEHIKDVELAITACKEWDASKDRDYEDEQRKNPIQFDYAALHYVVRAASKIKVGAVTVDAGTPCEIQIKTILQHAYSELTHDTIYKPKVIATPVMLRTAAKSMALIEATNDYFQQVVQEVSRVVTPAREITAKLSNVYRTAMGRAPELTRAESLLLDAYEPFGDDITERVESFLDRKPFIISRIQAQSATKLLYRQPSILLLYMLVDESPASTKSRWPLTPEELRPIYVDLGKSFDNY